MFQIILLGLHEFRNVIKIGLQHWVNKAYAFAMFYADNIFWKMVQVGPYNTNPNLTFWHIEVVFTQRGTTIYTYLSKNWLLVPLWSRSWHKQATSKHMASKSPTIPSSPPVWITKAKHFGWHQLKNLNVCVQWDEDANIFTFVIFPCTERA